ncbi:lipase 1-like [Zophobas morio]|uniref:lipase 1-like n=1 Tax=Zophobas morio TaxID=2755281 RepID=UPI00308357D1
MVHKIASVTLLTALFSVTIVQIYNKSKLKHPYADFTVQELVEKYEYPVEVHNVTTEDGYILTLHRIPHGKENLSQNRTPVLLLPGALQSSWDFVQNGPNQSLPFILSEKGYDVWLGNVRGTTLSRKHETLDPDKDLAFWDFTINEIGVYDLPALIDYVLETTKESSLHYVGFSQGTTVFFLMGSERSEYLSKVKLMSAFGPTVYMENPKSPIVKFIADNWKLGEALLNFFNYQELFSINDPMTIYLRYVCNDENSIFINLCVHHFSMALGDNYDTADKSMLSLLTSKSPCGASMKQLIHFYQMIDSGNFCKYDFGTRRNLEIYGQETPPLYNLSKVTIPVALYYSSNDWVIDITNMDRLEKTLPNVVKSYKVPLEKFNHGDFLFAKDVVGLLYNSVIDEISKY